MLPRSQVHHQQPTAPPHPTLAALMALKKKKMYEQQLEQVENNILRINENQLMLESTSTQMETVGALHQATKASKQAMADLNIDRVDKVLEEITETNDQLRMVQDALGAPLGPAAELDDDELLNELEVGGIFWGAGRGLCVMMFVWCGRKVWLCHSVCIMYASWLC